VAQMNLPNILTKVELRAALKVMSSIEVKSFDPEKEGYVTFDEDMELRDDETCLADNNLFLWNYTVDIKAFEKDKTNDDNCVAEGAVKMRFLFSTDDQETSMEDIHKSKWIFYLICKPFIIQQIEALVDGTPIEGAVPKMIEVLHKMTQQDEESGI